MWPKSLQGLPRCRIDFYNFDCNIFKLGHWWKVEGKTPNTEKPLIVESWKIKSESVLKVSKCSCFMRLCWFQRGGRMFQQRRTSTWKTRLQKKQLLQRQWNNLRAANGCSCALILEFHSCGQWCSYTFCSFLHPVSLSEEHSLVNGVNRLCFHLSQGILTWLSSWCVAGTGFAIAGVSTCR